MTLKLSIKMLLSGIVIFIIFRGVIELNIWYYSIGWEKACYTRFAGNTIAFLIAWWYNTELYKSEKKGKK